MSFVDCFVVPVPTDALDRYRKLARHCAKLWIEHGALSYCEALAEDVPHGKTTDFYRSVKATEDETVVVGWITYKSRRHREEVMKKVTADTRMLQEYSAPPFDKRRIFAGGFSAIAEKHAAAP